MQSSKISNADFFSIVFLFEKIFVICPTEKINPFYNSITKENCIFDQWNETWVNQLIDSMTKINSNKNTMEKKSALIILDDCMSDIDFNQSMALKKIYTRGRHFHLYSYLNLFLS